MFKLGESISFPKDLSKTDQFFLLVTFLPLTAQIKKKAYELVPNNSSWLFKKRNNPSLNFRWCF